MTWEELLRIHGSARRVFEAYWKGQLNSDVERFIESTIRPEKLIGYKPIAN